MVESQVVQGEGGRLIVRTGRLQSSFGDLESAEDVVAALQERILELEGPDPPLRITAEDRVLLARAS